MGAITQVRVVYGRKINLGNYSSANIEVELVVAVNPEENASQVIDGAFVFTKDKVKGIILPLIKETPKNAKPS